MISYQEKPLHEFTHYVLRKLVLKPNKSLGQNFLVSEITRNRIINLLDPKPEDTILEIGGGLGALSIPIAKSGAELTVYEIDRNLNQWLTAELVSYSKTCRILGDFLENYPLENLEDRKFKVIGNLPYQITSPILEKIYDSCVLPSEIIIMIQKEVAERISAGTGTKTRGRLTLWCEYHADIERSFDVKPGAFLPSPKVGSCVLKLKTKSSFALEADQKRRFFDFVKAAFSMKRKTLVNNLSAWNDSISKDEISKLMEGSGYDVRLRAEDLGLEDFLKLFNAMH